VNRVRWILASPFLLLIHTYRLLVSPVLHALTGVLGGGCRFQPTCSRYALDALHHLPLYRALPLILWRILRCNPWGASGYDPVPGTDRPSSPDPTGETAGN
jgi:putative membrane protein insertion efficiency factor